MGSQCTSRMESHTLYITLGGITCTEADYQPASVARAWSLMFNLEANFAACLSHRETRQLPSVALLAGEAKSQMSLATAWIRLCWTNPVRDSSRESSVITEGHRPAELSNLQDQELAHLQRNAQAPWDR